jgi:hypothetical protein
VTGEEAGEGAAEEKALPEREKVLAPPNVPRNRTLVYYNNTPHAGNVNVFASGYTTRTATPSCWSQPLSTACMPIRTTCGWRKATPTTMTPPSDVNFRRGIKWSDGTPFTANDVATSMERLKRVEGLNRSGTYKAELEAVEAVDDTTLKVTLNQTDWRFFFKSLTFRFDLGDYTAFHAEPYLERCPR